jgi:cytochrome c-type biogenesis protein CcmH
VARYLVAAAVAAILALFAAAAHAVEPGEMLKDPALEARARAIGEELRCVVCQNQSIEDSGADLAHDLRVLVRQRVKAGDTDRQVVAFIVARYGEFVLLDPPFKPATWALWLTPAVVLLLGLAGLAVWFRRRARVAAPPSLSPDEERRVAALIDRGADS